MTRFVLALLSVSIVLTACGPNAADLEAKAIAELEAGESKEAKELIDQALDATKEPSPKTIYSQGLIYAEYYQQFEKHDRSSTSRITAIKSLSTFLESDQVNDKEADVKAQLIYLTTTLYGDILLTLNTENHAAARKHFDLYRITMAKTQPDFDIAPQQVEFYMVLASVYMQIAGSSEGSDEEYREKACSTYKSVIDLDPESLAANYNLGIIYYKQGIGVAANANPSIDPAATLNTAFELIPAFRELEDDARDDSKIHFANALRFLETAYMLEPEGPVMNALLIIYFTLEMEDEFEMLQEELMDIGYEEAQ